MHVDIYSDGSSRGNPGPGGYGCIIRCVDRYGITQEREYSAGFLLTTNSRMERLGVITALEKLKYMCDVTVYTDSQYVVKPYTEGWIFGWKKNGWKNSSGEVKNKDLWIRLDGLVNSHKVKFVWIKGHDGHPENERCDKLAVAAAEGDLLKVDEGYRG